MVLEGEKCDNFEPNLFRPKICKNCMLAKTTHNGASATEGESKVEKPAPRRKKVSRPSWMKDEPKVVEQKEEPEPEPEPLDPTKNVCAVPPFGYFYPRTETDNKFKDGMDLMKNKLAVANSNLWPLGSTLSIKFLGGASALQDRVKKYIQEWFDVGINLSHTYVGAGPADIRIDFTQDQTSWSFVGTDAKLERNQGRPTLHLGWLNKRTPEEEVRRVVLHEFGHALGAIHEHQSPDTDIEWDEDKVYEFFQGPPNNWDVATIDFNIIDKARVSQTQYSEFDESSIMMYWFDPEWMTNDPPLEIPNNAELSGTDKEFMMSVYPKNEITEPIDHTNYMSLKSAMAQQFLNIEDNEIMLSDVEQHFIVEFQAGENAAFDNGSTFTLRESETGVKLDVEGRRVQARWTGKHPYQLFSIERADGDGDVKTGDRVYLWSNEWKRYLTYSADRDKVLCYDLSHSISSQWIVDFTE